MDKMEWTRSSLHGAWRRGLEGFSGCKRQRSGAWRQITSSERTGAYGRLTRDGRRGKASCNSTQAAGRASETGLVGG